MTQLLNGIIHITGEHDTGKTTFALECGASPDKICFFDDDVKGRATLLDLTQAGYPLGQYHDLTKMKQGKNELQFHSDVLDIIHSIKPGQFDAIIFDTWSYFAKTCHSFVARNPQKFRQNWNPMGKIKGAQQWQEAARYEAAIANYLASVSKTVILITHLKDFYQNDVKVPGKSIPDSGKTLDTIPRLRIWLRQNPDNRPVPIGLILKRIDKKVLDGNKLRTKCVLPRKITPNDDESSLWDTIWRYWDNPVGDRALLPEEMPDEYELSILDGTLTNDQKHLLTQMIEKGLIGNDDEELSSSIDDISLDSVEEISYPDTSKEVIARNMKLDGKTESEISEVLSMPLPIVRKWVSSVK